LLAACSFPAPPDDPPRAPDPRPSPEAPRLVVAIVVDQLPAWWLDRNFDALSPAGLVHRLAERGAWHRRVVLPHAATYTGPGHAAIFTGATPSDTGITANRVHVSGRGRVDVIDDGRHAVWSPAGGFASPAALRVETIGDVLRAADPRARVVALSIKDRGAVLSGGQQPDLVLWYEPSIPGFSTSSFYADARPAWLVEWERAHPVSARFTVWEPRDPALLAARAGLDDADGEGSWYGWARRFPHDLRTASDPAAALRGTPQGGEMLVDLATEVVDRLELGRDEHPDLLILSLSATDYVGHVFGPESWEALDGFVRLDQRLGEWVSSLEERGPVAVLVTSDHGVAPLPERVRARGGSAGRLLETRVVAALEEQLDAQLGPGGEPWVLDFVAPLVYLRGDPDIPRTEIRRAAAEMLAALEGVDRVLDLDELRARGSAGDPIEVAAALSVTPDGEGDLYVVPAPGWLVVYDESEALGSEHGSPWSWDREVPALLFGAGVRPGRWDTPVSVDRVAATLAAWLGVPPPAFAATTPLAGIPPVGQSSSSSAMSGR
jgi:arylsulfatase A-like enzyme